MDKLLRVPALITVAATSTVASGSSADDTNQINAPETTQGKAEEPSIYRQYVPLGDSYAAMDPRHAQVTGPYECFPSDDNYREVLAEDIAVRTSWMPRAQALLPMALLLGATGTSLLSQRG